MPGVKSKPEDTFLKLWREWGLGPDPIRNFQFLKPARKLEMDFAWPDIKLGVEMQGGIYSREKSGHSSIPGMKRDMEKNNLAQVNGWLLIWIEPNNVTKKNADQLQELLIEAAQLQVSRKAFSNEQRSQLSPPAAVETDRCEGTNLSVKASPPSASHLLSGLRRILRHQRLCRRLLHQLHEDRPSRRCRHYPLLERAGEV